MLGKILLTIIIVLLGLVWARKHREQERRAAIRSSAAQGKNTAAPLNDYRFAAYLFLTLMIGSGAYLYYLRWQDEHSLITVILHSDGTQSPVTYQVEKGQLEQRAFTTVEGIRVTVASSERMEVIGL